MIDLTNWSLFVDILLMGSLVFLAYRLTKAESVAVKIDKVGDLEKTLRRIINESQEASIELDQKLRSRQKDLEVLLTDLQSVENRVSGSFKESKAIKDELDKDLENGKLLIKKIVSLVNLVKQEKQANFQKPIINDDNKIEVASSENGEPLIDLVHEVENEETQRQSEKNYQVTNNNYEVKDKQYLVKDSFVRQAKNPQSLSNKIEKEVIENKPLVAKKDVGGMQRIYELAEVLLKRGVSSELVAERTTLSLDEVGEIKERLLLTNVNQNITTSNNDARLGVLSKMRREIATL